MEASIIENIERLYRSYLITAFLYLGLIIAAGLVTFFVIRLGILDSKVKRIALILVVAICSAGLIILQTVTIVPVHKDYTQRSYIVVENVTMIVKDGSTGGIDSTNAVELWVNGDRIDLKMQTDLTLDAETEYSGTVAYLEHSGFVVWFSFED